ncbi:MAG: OmpW/AlkL family protein [Gemmobacter sp.]
MRFALSALPLAAAIGLAAGPALAQSAGDWTLSFGLGHVNPKSNNGVLAGAQASINSNTQLTLGFGYFFTDNLALDVLAATPFRHRVSLAGLGEVATTKHLPPTVSVQYHFRNASGVTPFVGAGVNYTTFFSTRGVGPLAGQTVRIKDSFGIAVQGGVDMKVSDRGAIRADVRWINIRSDVTVNGANVGKAKIDPVVLGLSYVHRF